MSTNTNQPQGGPSEPDPLQLRTRPRRVTRVNRRVLIVVAGVGLALLAGLILVALDPPSWRKTGAGPELVTVERKATPDGLDRLPSSYDRLDAGKQAAPKSLPSSVPQLKDADPVNELERAEKVRLARLAAQARESGTSFRLQQKNAPTDPARNSALAAPSSPARTEPEPLAAAAAATTRLRSPLDGTPSGTDATDQTRKLAFLKAGPEKEIYNPHAQQTPVSPYQLMAGTIIAASLVTGLNSDLPGFVIAQVTEHVYDSVSGRFLLIPQGSRLVGRYDSVIAHGQQRALLVWQRIIRPDGSSIQIDNLPATDTAGYAGLQDGVDLHTWQLLKGIGLATVLGVGTSLAFGPTTNDSDLVRALRESTGQTTNRAGQRLIERELNVQPTLTVRPGWPLRIIVHKDIILTPYRN